jgi:hypothetical protein
MLPLEMGSKKLGQPQLLSNFPLLLNKAFPQTAQ